jgi:hypothetical protein
MLGHNVFRCTLDEQADRENGQRDRIHLAEDRQPERNVHDRVQDECDRACQRELVPLGYAGVTVKAISELSVLRKLSCDPPEQPKTQQQCFPLFPKRSITSGTPGRVRSAADFIRALP